MPPAAPAAPPTTSAQAMANLSGFQSGMKTPDQAAADAATATGVAGAQATATGLQGAIARTTSLLNNVAPSVMGRTAGSLVTDAQATKQIGNESAPIQADLTKNTADYSTANTALHDAQTAADSRAANTLTAQNGQMSYLQNMYNNIYTQEQDASKAAQAKAAAEEATRQFNAQLAASNANAAASRAASASSGASPSLGGSSGSTAYGAMSRNSTGGYGFTGAGNVPITMGQYLSKNGYGNASQIANAAAQLLAGGSSGDKAIASAISSGKYTPQQLAQKYPQVFGGSY